MRGSLTSTSKRNALQLRENHGEDALLVSRYFRIPESQHVITVCTERGVARPVPGIIRMLSAINFDDEPFLATNKINNVGADGLLPNEFETTQPSVA